MTTTGASTAAPTSTCTPSWEIPHTDIACAAPAHGNYSDVMDKCCKSASVAHYNDGCNLYCLAQDQSRKDLSDCMQSSGIKPNEVFCRGKPNATATNTMSATNTATDSGSTSTSSSTGTSSASGSASTSSGAAVANQPISIGGLGLVAMMFWSTLLGLVA